MDEAELEKLRWERYLYEYNTPEQLAAMARRLKYFRFCRDPGGAAGGGDALTVGLRCENEADLQRLFRALEIPLIPITPEDPVMQAGKSYTGEEYAKLVSPIGRFPRYRSPGHTHIRGIKVFVYVTDGVRIDVNEPDSVWSVGEAAARGAEALEPLIAAVADAVIDPPIDNKHCVCPKYYPEIWQS